MILVFLGKAGTGKGTQAKLLAKETGMLHASIGDILREEISKKTALGKEINEIIKTGALIPDSIVVRLVEGWLEKSELEKGVIFDGFPRTSEQAEGFGEMLAEHGLKVDFAVNFAVPEKLLLERLALRWTCKKCKKTYNAETNPPKKQGICDLDCGQLFQRDDDKESLAVKERFRIYDEQIKPILELYKGRIIEVDATPPIEEVARQVKKILSGKAK